MPDGPADGPVDHPGFDRDRLVALLGGPDLLWLRLRIRARLERGGAATGTATLRNPSDAPRAAVDRLLGRRPSRGSTVTVDLDGLDRMVRDAGICDGLRVAVEVLDGPIEDRAGRARAEAAAWERLLASMADGPDVPVWRRSWRDDLAATGLLRRLGGDPIVAARLVARADRVLDALPARAVPRARLAARVLQDSHALDDGRAVTTLVLKACQHRHLPLGERGPLPTGTDDLRALWAAAGVLLDELSGPVLSLGITAAGSGLVDAVLGAHAAAGEPVRSTLRALLRHPPDLTPMRGTAVHVCENPAVVSAAADALGTACRPLVCTEGWPSAAVQTLLWQLSAVGAELVHHGDFDPSGVAITDMLVRRFGAVPWRFDVAAYRAAPSGPPLGSRVKAVSWDRHLADEINARGVAVHEEQVIDVLLADLAT